MTRDGAWIRVDDLKGMLNSFRHTPFHPKDPQYRLHWQKIREKCINGIFYPQPSGWRYIPGRLGFYGVYCRFDDWDKETRTRIVKTPLVRDLEWHRAYYLMEAKGFSGFAGDPKYTSDYAVLTTRKRHLSLSDPKTPYLLKSNGKFKEFVPPREMLFDLLRTEEDAAKLGIPLYNNQATNHIEMGTRGGGKSYWYALGYFLYDLCFNGLTSYVPGKEIASKAVLEITSGQAAKSAETIEKVEFGLEQLALDETLGVHGEPGDRDYHPNPFWKRMKGKTDPNNREDPWINRYRVKMRGKWVKRGTGSSIYHTVYAKNTTGGAQKSAGGRRTGVLHEEIGLNDRLIEAFESNKGMVRGDGIQLAPQIGIGTSGNIKALVDARKMMTHPADYNCLSFKHPDIANEHTCWFLPAWMADMRFKDENGNTDIKAAQAEYQAEYEDKARAKDPAVFVYHRMNYPIKIEDMWVSISGSRLPTGEAEQRERDLMTGNEYEKLGTPIKMWYDSDKPCGVSYRVDHEADPIWEWPISSNRDNFEGAFMMWIHPDKLKINGMIPNDAVIVLHDPYVSEELSEGGSLGASFGIVNPRYIPYGLPGNMMCFSYIARPKAGTDAYNDTLLKGLMLYGSPHRNVWYEANRGDKFRGFMIRKKKAFMLALRPQYEQGQFIFHKEARQTGFYIGGGTEGLQKITLVDALRDWLLQEQTLMIDGTEQTFRIIEKIPDIFVIRQIRDFDLKKNFDAISALLGISLAIGEQEHRILHKERMKNNPLRILTDHYAKRMEHAGYNLTRTTKI